MTPCYAQGQQEQFKQLIEQLQKSPGDEALRAQVIRTARETRPTPVVPDAAIEFEGRAQYAFRNAKSEADYFVAAREYEKAVGAAPWVPGYYSDTASTLCGKWERGAFSVSAFSGSPSKLRAIKFQ